MLSLTSKGKKSTYGYVTFCYSILSDTVSIFLEIQLIVQNLNNKGMMICICDFLLRMD